MLVFVGLLVTASVWAAIPTPPTTLTPGPTSTYNPSNFGLQSHSAIAGNITGLVLVGLSQTKAWQGYYGNITGTITLDDANNFTFYNWSSSEPRGQVYATLNTTIAWTTVGCFNFTSAGGLATWQTIETYYGIANDNSDGVNETFTATNHPSFQVGSRTMTGCPTTYINQNDTAQAANFVNVLLYDNTTINETGWIYTTLIENKTAGSTNELICYNGQPCDFQILINEDGHGTNTATTTYYFWVELL